MRTPLNQDELLSARTVQKVVYDRLVDAFYGGRQADNSGQPDAP
jgi:hypothetical protein